LITARLNCQPKVSIVCVAYNQKSYILKTLNSFVSQETTFDYEIIIGDDASTDGTTEIIQEFYQKYKNIVRPVFRTKNVGGKRNLLSVLELVRSDYIAYCEGDDYWIDSKKLQKQFDFMELNLDVGLVWTDINIVDEQEDKVIQAVFANKKLPIFYNLQDILVNKPFFAPSTWFFRSKFSYFFCNNDYIDGTFSFILEILQVSKMSFIDKVTACYTKRTESVSNSFDRSKRFNFAKGVYNIQIDYASKMYPEILNLIEYNHYKSLLSYAITEGDIDFIIRARRKLSNSKELGVLLLLFLSKNKILSYFIKVIVENRFINKAFVFAFKR
jgi:glucosyltransferase